MRRGAEPVHAEPLCLARHPQRPVADQPSAEQWRGFEIAVSRGDREAETRVGDGLFRVAAVDLIPGEARPGTEVFASGKAERARSAGPAEPGHADPVAGANRVTPSPVRATVPTIS